MNVNIIDSIYCNGDFITPDVSKQTDIINPANDEVIGNVILCSNKEVDLAVNAARTAFYTFSKSSRKERYDLIQKIVALLKKNNDELARLMTLEMGAPDSLSRTAQVGAGVAQFENAAKALMAFSEFEDIGDSRIIREATGVVGLITPWNWPLNQIACKVAPALAAGCTIVLKPSEKSPLSAQLFAKILHQAGVPKGVFNLIHGDGVVGEAIASHQDIDMVSFTGSTRAGIAVAISAAPTVKKVHQELGGKSANIMLEDVDLNTVIPKAIHDCFGNSGQSCNAPTRLLVHESIYDQAVIIAAKTANDIVVGDPKDVNTVLGPVANKDQYAHIQNLIEKGIAEGAVVAAGGLGRPDGLTKGCYVKPTILSQVNNDMSVAQEEIFGPVLVVIPFSTDEEAVAIANASPYGLSAYVTSTDRSRSLSIAEKIRAGQVHINGAPVDLNLPFGGFKCSGNGREWGKYGLLDYFEVKSFVGYHNS